jgi:DnaK suppressor protein
MDETRVRKLLAEERHRIEVLLAESRHDAASDRSASAENGDIADPAERLTAEGIDDAVVSGLEARLAAIGRSEKRLEDGTYGRSVRSGLPIPDDRLAADPAAELTVEEAAEKE